MIMEKKKIEEGKKKKIKATFHNRGTSNKTGILPISLKKIKIKHQALVFFLFLSFYSAATVSCPLFPGLLYLS